MFDYRPDAKMQGRDYARTGVWTLRAPMLALSNPDPALGFPEGTTLQPQIFVRNATAKSINASLRFNWRDDATTGQGTGPALRLNPHETRRIDVAALQDGKTLPKNARWSSITLTTDGKPDEVLAVATSYDSTLAYGAQTPFSDQLTFKWEGGQWEVDALHDSIITAGNGGTDAAKVAFTIYYNEGSAQYGLEQTLQPDEQMWVDVGKLIRGHVPDKNGNVLPDGLSTGSYEVRDLTHNGAGTLFEGKVIYDKTYGHAAYGCAECCGYADPYFFWDPLAVIIQQEQGQDVDALDMCNGGFPDDVTFYFNFGWSVENTNIATVDDYGNHTGMSVGSTSSLAFGLLNNNDVPQECPLVGFSPSGPDNVVKVQITDADIENNNVDVTISCASGESGVLTVTANGSSNNVQVSANNGSAVGSGNYTVSFNRPSMPVDTYTTITAAWGGVSTTLTLSRSWVVVGTIRHSQYNTPYESSCTTPTQTAYLYNASCTWQTVTLRAQFVSQAELNGSGVSISYGDLQYDSGKMCNSNRPAGSNTSNSFLMISSITGQCNTALIGGIPWQQIPALSTSIRTSAEIIYSWFQRAT